VGNTLIDLYAKCSDIDDARKVFDTMIVHDLVSWNAMIVGYAQNGQGKNTVELFSQKHQAGMKDDEFTFASMLSACANLSAMEERSQVHAHIIKT
jgi:pentatricopeptide repeat protein